MLELMAYAMTGLLVLIASLAVWALIRMVE